MAYFNLSISFNQFHLYRLLLGYYGFGTLASRTACDDGLMTALVNDTSTDLTLITLFPNTPNKFSAVGAEGRLSKEGCHELVTIDLKEISVL